jgi:hypothetical protein
MNVLVYKQETLLMFIRINMDLQDGKPNSLLELLNFLHKLPPNRTLSGINQKLLTTTESVIDLLDKLRQATTLSTTTEATTTTIARGVTTATSEAPVTRTTTEAPVTTTTTDAQVTTTTTTTTTTASIIATPTTQPSSSSTTTTITTTELNTVQQTTTRPRGEAVQEDSAPSKQPLLRNGDQPKTLNAIWLELGDAERNAPSPASLELGTTTSRGGTEDTTYPDLDADSPLSDETGSSMAEDGPVQAVAEATRLLSHAATPQQLPAATPTAASLEPTSTAAGPAMTVASTTESIVAKHSASPPTLATTTTITTPTTTITTPTTTITTTITASVDDDEDMENEVLLDEGNISPLGDLCSDVTKSGSHCDHPDRQTPGVALIAGLTVGILVCLALLAACLSVWLCRKSQNRKLVYATMDGGQPRDFTKSGPPVILQDEFADVLYKHRHNPRPSDKVTEL